MIADIDILRAAALLVKLHGDDAAVQAAAARRGTGRLRSGFAPRHGFETYGLEFYALCRVPTPGPRSQRRYVVPVVASERDQYLSVLQVIEFSREQCRGGR